MSPSAEIWTQIVEAYRDANWYECVRTIRPVVEEEPHDQHVEPAHDPIPRRDLDAQLSRSGASRALGRIHQAAGTGLASSVPPRAGSVTRRRAHAPIASSIVMSTKMAR